MELQTAIEILVYHQEWRLGKREDMIHEPKILTQALDTVLSHYSQNRELGLKKYEPIFVKYVSGTFWEVRRFSHFKDGRCFVYYSQNMEDVEESGTYEVDHWSIDNPLKKEI